MLNTVEVGDYVEVSAAFLSSFFGIYSTIMLMSVLLGLKVKAIKTHRQRKVVRGRRYKNKSIRR